jgi:hypothetical protein
VRIWVTCAAVLVAASCGGAEDGNEQPEASAGDHLPLDVYVVDATIVGGPPVDVVAEPAGTLAVDGALTTLVTFTAHDEPVPVAGLAFLAREVASVDGTGTLGARGVCGLGREPDGTRTTVDPCVAAEPVAFIAAGTTASLPLVLAPRTPSGPPRPDRYIVEVPLGFGGTAGGSLTVTYDIGPRDETRLPTWDSRSATLRISLEPYSAPLAALDGEGRIELVVEDPYRREVWRGDAPSGVGDAVEVLVPRGTWHVVALVADDHGDLVRCGSQPVVVGAAGAPLTLLLAVDDAGRCTRS